MIDLRSDTLTLPDHEMLASILTAPLGDDGRLDKNGQGEDPSVRALEDLSAHITGKESAMFCCSGTMANQTALLTYCHPHDRVLVNQLQHLFHSEKMAFHERYGQLIPVFYQLDQHFMPDIEDIQENLTSKKISLLCIENTHNFSGGTCINLQRMSELEKISHACNVPIHMDGARLFNAAAALHTSAAELCRHVDSVQFCFSKGLGAPIGSVLCGPRAWIQEARKIRKLLGGNMRQAGVMAAPAMYALKHNISRLEEDHQNTAFCADLLSKGSLIHLKNSPQTNIVMIDIQEFGCTPEQFCHTAEKKGLRILPGAPGCVRLVFYKGVTRHDAAEAARILLQIDQEKSS